MKTTERKVSLPVWVWGLVVVLAVSAAAMGQATQPRIPNLFTPSTQPATQPAGNSVGRRTDEQSKYFAYADMYFRACKESNLGVLALRPGRNTIGVLHGHLKILQHLNDRKVLGSCHDQAGDELFTCVMSNVGVGHIADGERVGLSEESIFVCEGTVSYTTILGAKRTVYGVERLDREKFDAAMREVKAIERSAEAEQEAQREKDRAEAKAAADAASKALSDFKGASAPIRQYLDAISAQKMYAPFRDRSDKPEMTAKLKAAESELKRLGDPPSPEAIAKYRNEMQRLSDASSAADRELKRIAR